MYFAVYFATVLLVIVFVSFGRHLSSLCVESRSWAPPVFYENFRV